MKEHTVRTPEQSPFPNKRTLEAYLSQYLPLWLIRGIVYGISAAAVLILIGMFYSSWKSLQEYTWNLAPLPILYSFLAYLAAVGLAVVVWARMLRTFGGVTAWRSHIRAFCVSRIGYRLPGPMLHIPGRLMLYEGRIPTKIIFLGSGLELLVMMVASILVGILSGRSFDNFAALGIGLAVSVALLAALPGLVAWFSKKGYLQISRRIRFRDLFEWTLWHVLIWILGALTVFFLINAFYPLSVAELPSVVAAWSISGVVSIIVVFLPMGLGLRELSFSLLLSSFMPSGIAVLTAVLSRFLLMAYDFIIAGCAYYLIHPDTQNGPAVGIKNQPE